MRMVRSVFFVLAAISTGAEAQQQMVQVLPPPIVVRIAPPSGCPLEPYPRGAIEAQAAGSTTLAFSMDSEGFLRHTAILRSAGSSPEHKLLDAASVRSLWACRFARPDRTNVHYNVTYEWKLPDAPGGPRQ
jgi:outer membrane biosynthesis protein TonB